MTGQHRQAKSRFDAGEPSELFALGILVDSPMLLGTHENEEGHLDIIQHEQSRFGFQAAPECNASLHGHIIEDFRVKLPVSEEGTQLLVGNVSTEGGHNEESVDQRSGLGLENCEDAACVGVNMKEAEGNLKPSEGSKPLKKNEYVSVEASQGTSGDHEKEEEHLVLSHTCDNVAVEAVPLCTDSRVVDHLVLLPKGMGDDFESGKTRQMDYLVSDNSEACECTELLENKMCIDGDNSFDLSKMKESSDILMEVAEVKQMRMQELGSTCMEEQVQDCTAFAGKTFLKGEQLSLFVSAQDNNTGCERDSMGQHETLSVLDKSMPLITSVPLAAGKSVLLLEIQKIDPELSASSSDQQLETYDIGVVKQLEGNALHVAKGDFGMEAVKDLVTTGVSSCLSGLACAGASIMVENSKVTDCVMHEISVSECNHALNECFYHQGKDKQTDEHGSRNIGIVLEPPTLSNEIKVQTTGFEATGYHPVNADSGTIDESEDKDGLDGASNKGRLDEESKSLHEDKEVMITGAGVMHESKEELDDRSKSTCEMPSEAESLGKGNLEDSVPFDEDNPWKGELACEIGNRSTELHGATRVMHSVPGNISIETEEKGQQQTTDALIGASYGENRANSVDTVMGSELVNTTAGESSSIPLKKVVLQEDVNKQSEINEMILERKGSKSPSQHRKKKKMSPSRSQIGTGPNKGPVIAGPTAPRGTSVIDFAVLDPVYLHDLVQSLNKESSASTAKQQLLVPNAYFSQAQQVQLRAQILVYGSIIQGAVPEETLMLAAFVDTGGDTNERSNNAGHSGRRLWEKTWRTSLERDHSKIAQNSQKGSNFSGSMIGKVSVANVSNPNERLQENSVEKLVSSCHREGESSLSTFPARSGQLGFPNTSGAIAVANSSAFSYADVQQVLGRPLFPTSCGASFVAVSGHLFPSGFRGAWIPPPPQYMGYTSAAQFTQNQSMLSATFACDTASGQKPLLIAVSSVPCALGSPDSVIGTSSAAITINASCNQEPFLQNDTAVHSVSDLESRPKKRKISEVDHSQGCDTSEARQMNLAKAAFSSPQEEPLVNSLAIVVMSTEMTRKSSETSTIVTPSLSPLTKQPLLSVVDFQKEMPLSQTNLATQFEKSKLNAEEASLLAESAMKESELMWSELKVEISAGLLSETDKQLMSSAIAMRTAASIAKAAAAAARIAFEAALQAKFMRDEALKSSAGADVEDDLWTKGNISNPTEALKLCKTSDAMLSLIKTASKRQLQEANATVIRAQNRDSLVRAAELAVKVVSHVGALVAVGDSPPFNLEAILQAGREGFYDVVSPGLLMDDEGGNEKTNYLQVVDRTSPKCVAKSKGKDEESVIAKSPSTHKDSKGTEETAHQNTKYVTEPFSMGVAASQHAAQHIVDALQHTTNIAKVHQPSQALGDIAILQVDLSTETAQNELPTARTEKNCQATVLQIMRDSIIEVLSDEEGFRGVWYSAKVLRVEDGKALVLYDELLADDGLNPLEEWIDLVGMPGGMPRVRLAHPSSNIAIFGTRKRRREAMGHDAWSVGDRVDAWIRDGWWEGEILNIHDNVEGKAIKVFFPGEGYTRLIKASNLRPSLVWSNGNWILWMDMKLEAAKHSAAVQQEGETPKAKRQRTEGKRAPLHSLGEKQSAGVHAVEKVNSSFAVEVSTSRGGSAKMRTNSSSALAEANKNLNTNQGTKEASKVMFGVPKPTKKKRLKEVTKHLTTGQLQLGHPGHDALKCDDHTERSTELCKAPLDLSKADESKAKRRPPFSVQIRPRRGGENTKVELVGPPEKAKPLLENVHKDQSTQDGLDLGVPSKVQIIEHPDSHDQSDDKSSRSNEACRGYRKASESLRANENKPFRVVKKKDKNDAESVHEMLEPRRSSRKIQPTSRLLEGLQTAVKLGKSRPG